MIVLSLTGQVDLLVIVVLICTYCLLIEAKMAFCGNRMQSLENLLLQFF